MKLEDIKQMGIRHKQHIEIRYRNKQGEFEQKSGYFWELMELPEGTPEIPEEYKHAYPVDPPFVTVAYTLDRNWCVKESTDYPVGDIDFIRVLKPEWEL